MYTTTISPTTSQRFLSKVFFFFGLAILSSALGTFFGLNFLAKYFIAHPALIYIAFAAELILVFTSRMWSERRPMNYLFFILFSFITGITLVPIVGYLAFSGGIDLVVKALAATACVFTASAIFGYTTSFNLTGLRGFLSISLIGMIVISLIGIFFPWGSTFEMIFSGFGVILFAGYTMYDLQNLKNYPETMYIDAALKLYLDIFNLFLYILRLLTSFSGRD